MFALVAEVGQGYSFGYITPYIIIGVVCVYLTIRYFDKRREKKNVS